MIEKPTYPELSRCYLLKFSIQNNVWWIKSLLLARICFSMPNSIFYLDGALRSLGIPFFAANTRAWLPWLHHWDASQWETCKYILSRSPRGFPRFGYHVMLFRWKIHTSYNLLDITITVKLHSRFQTNEMYSFEICACLTRECCDYIRLQLWRHRTCIATYSPKRVVSAWSWWYRFNRGIILLKKWRSLIATT